MAVVEKHKEISLIVDDLNRLIDRIGSESPSDIANKISRMDVEEIRSLWIAADQLQNVTWHIKALIVRGMYLKYQNEAKKKGIEPTIKDIMVELTSELKVGRTQIYNLYKAGELLELRPDLVHAALPFKTITYAIRYTQSLEEAANAVDLALAHGLNSSELKAQIEHKKSKRSVEYVFKLVPASKDDIDVSELVYSGSVKIYKTEDGFFALMKIAGNTAKEQFSSLTSTKKKK